MKSALCLCIAINRKWWFKIFILSWYKWFIYQNLNFSRYKFVMCIIMWNKLRNVLRFVSCEFLYLTYNVEKNSKCVKIFSEFNFFWTFLTKVIITFTLTPKRQHRYYYIKKSLKKFWEYTKKYKILIKGQEKIGNNDNWNLPSYVLWIFRMKTKCYETVIWIWKNYFSIITSY